MRERDFLRQPYRLGVCALWLIAAAGCRHDDAVLAHIGPETITQGEFVSFFRQSDLPKGLDPVSIPVRREILQRLVFAKTQPTMARYWAQRSSDCRECAFYLGFSTEKMEQVNMSLVQLYMGYLRSKVPAPSDLDLYTFYQSMPGAFGKTPYEIAMPLVRQLWISRQVDHQFAAEAVAAGLTAVIDENSLKAIQPEILLAGKS